MIVRILGLLLLVASLAGGWLWLTWQDSLQQQVQVPTQGLDFEIEPGQSFAGVAGRLAKLGVIRDPHFIAWQARLDGIAQRIQAGRYHIDPGLSVTDLVALFVNGRVVESSITIIEGWTFRRLMQELHQHPALAHELDGLSDPEIMQRLGYPDQHPEGRFLPETYVFPEGGSDVDLLRRAYASMQTVLDEEWAVRVDGLPYASPDEALIMASIIEKETGIADERSLVAGVFVRRLRMGMRLQTDPTVIYGLGETFDGDLRRADLRRDTPYNTYVHTGLTPTPIALPGRASIHAALHPADGNSLYFVANGNGGHHFSATLEEHQAAVRKYQLKR